MIETAHWGLAIIKSVYQCNNISGYIFPYHRDRPHLKSHVHSFILYILSRDGGMSLLYQGGLGSLFVLFFIVYPNGIQGGRHPAQFVTSYTPPYIYLYLYLFIIHKYP